MRRRPWPIVILAFFQVLVEPFNNLFLNAWFSHTSARIYLTYFFESKQWLTLFYLFVLPPVMGISAYAMKKWSYYVFVAGATWMLFHNFGLVREGNIRLSYAICLYIGNIGFVSYFLLPRVHAPYMNPKMRWWESKTRFLVDWPCRISSTDEQATVSCRVQDFSEGGVFILSPDTIPMNQVIEIRMSPESSEIVGFKAKPVFSRPVQNGLGYGLQFVELNKSDAKRLALLSKSLRKSGTSFRNGQDDAWAAFKGWALRLVTTGEGLLPEAERSPARAAQTASSSPAEASTKSA
ncbi:MAG: PilZ domain-containing protein [Bdellovibrionia bacterium]